MIAGWEARVMERAKRQLKRRMRKEKGKRNEESRGCFLRWLRFCLDATVFPLVTLFDLVPAAAMPRTVLRWTIIINSIDKKRGIDFLR